MGGPTTEILAGRASGMDVHQLTHELNAALGPTLVAALAGVKGRQMPLRWADPDGPVPENDDIVQRLELAHRAWTMLVEVDGADVARQWFIGGNPVLNDRTPITAIREGRWKIFWVAVTFYIDGGGGA